MSQQPTQEDPKMQTAETRPKVVDLRRRIDDAISDRWPIAHDHARARTAVEAWERSTYGRSGRRSSSASTRRPA